SRPRLFRQIVKNFGHPAADRSEQLQIKCVIQPGITQPARPGILIERHQQRIVLGAFYLQLFGTIRSGMAEVLNNLPEEAWARTGIHNVAGKITLQDIVESYIGHVNDHVQQIERNKAAFAKGNR
ncbi:MAG: hypothetical protein K0R75_4033, partial [Paenibacillaceae bacterium]|nr:hypothetical protein [Paenibacillaceae bacterium]